MTMKRRRVMPRTPGGPMGATPCTIDYAYSNDQTNVATEKLPRIPGFPIERIPSFLRILQLTSKFFQTERAKQPFTVVEWEILNDKSANYCDVGDNSCSYGGGTWNLRDGNKRRICINTTIHDNIMDRMESISNNSGLLSTASTIDDDREKKFVAAMADWMNSIQLLARQRKRQQPVDGTSATTATTSEKVIDSGKQRSPEKQDVSQPIPYSIFLYLWEMQQQHKRVTVRRSALFLSGLLLLRSKDCRSHLDQETNLAEWISNIVAKLNGGTILDVDNASLEPSLRKKLNSKASQLALLRREAFGLISHLIDKGFGKIYTKLAVAAKSLRHQCGASALDASDLTMSTITPPGMANWRRLRDFALLHGRKELYKVRKLLDQADECLEILVPRIEGFRRSSTSPTSWKEQLGNKKNYGCVDVTDENEICNNQDSYHHRSNDNGSGDEHSSESDEDDINWEDGNDTEKNCAGSVNHGLDLHLSAVENTIAVMEKTAGTTLFSGGKLEINFDRRMDGDCLNDGVGTRSDNLASNENQSRRKLEKIVQKLSNRHLVRLSAWLDGLRNADNLIQMESTSLVSLSPRNDDLRLELISRLSVLREDVTRVVSSASRLNIKVHNVINEAHGSSAQTLAQNQTRNVVVSLEGMHAVTERAQLPNRRVLKKKNEQCRFSRIKIKYNKRVLK